MPREAGCLADERGVQQNLVRGCALAAHLGELDIEQDRSRPAGVSAVGIEDDPRTCRRIELDDQLGRLGSAVERREAETRWVLEDEANLGLGDRGCRLPVRMKNGTPDQRQLSISSRSAAYVLVDEFRLPRRRSRDNRRTARGRSAQGPQG